MRGYDIRTVQELLGHASVKAPMIYSYILNCGGVKPTARWILCDWLKGASHKAFAEAAALSSMPRHASLCRLRRSLEVDRVT
jgi:hypothetical protein